MKGWLDNFGKADNANDSNISLPEGFVGLGYNTKGRNYSPAWGGQFQDGGELIPVSPAQQIAKGVQPIPTVPYLQTKDPAEFYKSWIQSPEYARRQLLTGYVASPEDQSLLIPSAQKSREIRLGALENIAPITYSGREASEARPGLYGSPSYININPADYIDTSKESIMAHELAHLAGATVPKGTTRPGVMSAKEQEIFNKSMLPLKEPTLSGVQGSKEREASKRALEDFIHSKKPEESKADLDAIRFMMYDKGIYDITKGKKFTEADFEKAKQSLGKDRVFKRLTDRVGKKNFVNLMNTIALADQEEAPIAMGGMSIPGSVGFTYARTAGAAPSEGPYAKKTLPSAQNGIMSPLLLTRKILNYFYPDEEGSVTVAPIEYKKGLTDELLKRQAYKESTFNPSAVSPAGYKGLTQIGEEVLTDYSKKKGGKKLDPFNPKDAVELQKFAMDDLYNASFINKPDQPDSVRLAKTLAAYNWGRGNLFNYLNEQKQKGVDIYNSYDWLNDLPKETSDYVNKILLQEDESFNKRYKKDSTNPKYKDVTSLYDQKKFGGKITTAQNGQEMRFYQNGLDWKPKSMQEGGKIYEGQELPEFVVEGKDDRLKQAMYEGSNRFLQGLVGVMGSPQTGLMEVITGKQQTPSQAFGFQNTGSWLDNYSSFGKNLSNLAMDVVLDPINLLGVGIADDIARTTVKGLSKKVASKEVPSKVGKITGLRAGVTADDVNNLIDKNINYIESDEYLQRRMATTGESKEQVLKDVSKYKDRLKNTTINLSASGQGGLMNPINIPYLTNKKIKVGKGIADKEEVLGVLDHEIKHMLSPASEFPLFSPNTTSGGRYGKYSNYPELEINSPTDKYDYFRDPMEQQVRMLKLNEKIRQDLGIKDIRKITEKEFDSWKSKHLDETLNNPRYRDFKQIYEDATDKGRSDLLNTLNRLWAAPAIGVFGAQAIEQDRNGSSVKQFQDGGSEKISINDPRYPELYKNRQVGAYYDGAFTLPDLPEVTVTAPRSYTMDSLRDFTTAALYGAPANAMKLLTIPQALMTERIEALRGKPYDFSNADPNLGYFGSNQRDLSQTMGYENPQGFLQNAANVGLSMIDPLNLLGVGVIDDITKGGIRKFGKELRKEVLENYNPANLKTKSALEWSKKWYNDPKTLERKISSAYEDPSDEFFILMNNKASKDYIDYAKEALDQYEPKNYIDLLKDKGLKDYILYGNNSRGVSYGNPNAIYVNRTFTFPFNRKRLESTRAHELSHLVNFNGLNLNRFEESQLMKPFGFKDNIDKFNKIEKIGSKSKQKELNYFTEPTEIKARMDQARFDLGLSPEDEFTPEMFDQISKKNDFYGMRKYIKDKKSFVDLMNKFWAVPAVGAVVGSQAADQQKNGGVTKDNQGYWNPDNWGKPVEIDSNIITMQGVYEPLLGISDTGDTKLMKPGKNYKFKGSKVTEFPVAELGINQLDAQPMKKLNQLLNFTNNPDKDNWLDKYN